jgi:hypothetical protein
MIQVDQQNASVLSRSRSTSQLSFQQVERRAAAPEPCQIVVGRLIAKRIERLHQVALQQKYSVSGSDAGMQLPDIERLRKVVIGSCVKTLNDFMFLVLTGEKQNVLIAICLARPDAAAEFDSVNAGHHSIKNEQVRSDLSLKQFPGHATILNREYFVAPGLQSRLQDAAEHRVVVCDEHLPARRLVGFDATQISKCLHVQNGELQINFFCAARQPAG